MLEMTLVAAACEVLFGILSHLEMSLGKAKDAEQLYLTILCRMFTGQYQEIGAEV